MVGDISVYYRPYNVQLVTFQFTTGLINQILTSVNYGFRKKVTLAPSSIDYHSERVAIKNSSFKPLKDLVHSIH